jgi:hypothetical protein
MHTSVMQSLSPWVIIKRRSHGDDLKGKPIVQKVVHDVPRAICDLKHFIYVSSSDDA